MDTFSVVSSSTSEVVKALRAYLEEAVPSDFASLLIDAEKPHKWQVTGTVFVDYIPLGVLVCAKTCGEEVSVSVTHTTHNDLIRFNSMLKEMLAFLKTRGLQTSGNLPVSNFPQRFVDDDDFGFSDDEEDDEEAWEEMVQPILKDTCSIRTEVREEAFRAIAQWAATNPASHDALAKGFIDRAAELSSLFCTSSQASAAETYPFAVAIRKLSEGFLSTETRDELLQSPLSTMMEPTSKPRVPAVVAREYKMAMQALGKVEVAKPMDDIYIVQNITDKDQVKKSIQFEPSKERFYNSSEIFAEHHLVVGGY